jgi:hypothetical protein
MKTLDLHEAAEFLRMNPQVLRRKAYNGEIPGRKTGKSFMKETKHLSQNMIFCSSFR